MTTVSSCECNATKITTITTIKKHGQCPSFFSDPTEARRFYSLPMLNSVYISFIKKHLQWLNASEDTQRLRDLLIRRLADEHE